MSQILRDIQEENNSIKSPGNGCSIFINHNYILFLKESNQFHYKWILN